MTYRALVLAVLSSLMLTACPPTRGGEDPPPGGTSALWLAVTETYQGDPGYTSHMLLHSTGGSMSCSGMQDYYETFSDAYLQRNEDLDALNDKFDGSAWDDVEYVRAYCEIESQ